MHVHGGDSGGGDSVRYACTGAGPACSVLCFKASTVRAFTVADAGAMLAG